MEHKLKQSKIARNVTITIPLGIAETLQGLIDGCIGTSESDEFNKEMSIVLKKLDRQVNKRYKQHINKPQTT